MKNWLKSSQTPEQVSHTVRGAVLALSALLLGIAQSFGIPFTENDIVNVANHFGLVAGSLWFFYGLTMKVVMYFGSK